MTTSTTRTPLYNLWSRWPEDQLPPEMAAFFMAGALPPGEMEDLCSFLLLPLLPCKLSSWRWALALPCGAWSICWRATARITQRPKARASSSLWLIRCNKSGERKSTIQTERAVRSRNIVETQDLCYNKNSI